MRIAIADDHQIFRDGLRRLLESEAGFEVVAEGTDGLDAVRIIRETAPDVMLLDVAMPRMEGLETLSAVSATPTRVILLTAAIEPTDLLRAIQLGARGVVLKESATRLLIDGIHRVMDDKYVIGAGVADDLAQAVRQIGTPPARRYALTPRELEIVAAIVAGDSNREIADRLGISLKRSSTTSRAYSTRPACRAAWSLRCSRSARGSSRPTDRWGGRGCRLVAVGSMREVVFRAGLPVPVRAPSRAAPGDGREP